VNLVNPIISGCLAVAAFGGIVAAVFSAAPRDREVVSYATSLEGRTFSQRHNARMAARALDGAVVGPGEAFSFNRRVGSLSRDRGYRKAPVSFNGQLIDDWGGGVCQTSTTLYNAALLSGMKILERNHHHFCPSYVPPGRDAAVAYPSIDLRFKNPYAFPIRVHAAVDEEKIEVAFYANAPLPAKPEVVAEVERSETPATFYLGDPSNRARVRNSGRAGYDVTVYRITGNRKEIVSTDEYPVMNRVIEFRP